MDRRPTGVDYSDLQWFWPSWKFNLPIDDLFGNLFDQYNKIDIAIQEPTAFHHDVLEVSSTATTKEEFHALLKQRKEKRLQELRQCWSSVAISIAADPPLLEGNRNEDSMAERWAAFLHFSREFSFDALARYFSLFTHNSRSSPAAIHPPARSDSWSSSHTRRTSSPPASTPLSSTASQTPPRRMPSKSVGSDTEKKQKTETKYMKNEHPANRASTASQPRSRKRPLESMASHNEEEQGMTKRSKEDEQSTMGAEERSKQIGEWPTRKRCQRSRTVTSPPATLRTGDSRPVRRSCRLAARVNGSKHDAATLKTS